MNKGRVEVYNMKVVRRVSGDSVGEKRILFLEVHTWDCRNPRLHSRDATKRCSGVYFAH